MIANAMASKILIIDDELGPRESLRILLKPDYEVHLADSVRRGLELLQEVQPDVVVMDIRMPGMSGIDGLREIRKIDQSVAVIMLTGFGALETAQEAIRLGANDYLKKPFDTKEMVQVIRRNVERSEVNRKRHHTERELQDLNRRLVGELARKDRMASLGQASAELVHDLRNPLTVIMGYIQILSEDLEKTKNPTEKTNSNPHEYMDVIEKSVTRCKDLVETWLSLSRCDPRQYREVLMRPLVSDTVKGLLHLAQEKQARLEFYHVDDDCPVQGDSLQLARTLQNLIANAIDALPPRGGLVEVLCVPEGNGEVAIDVKDNGCGIESEKLDKVFDPYYTTKGASKGTGLGLFITRKIVEDHAGKIAIRSQPGQGTTVSMRLRRSQPVSSGA